MPNYAYGQPLMKQSFFLLIFLLVSSAHIPSAFAAEAAPDTTKSDTTQVVRPKFSMTPT